ncbi:MAG TPA: ion transporter [bacterium]|nr:ion transporter [bacterium]
MVRPDKKKPRPAWKKKLHTVIFEAETPGGKAFDVGLLIAIVTSVLVVVIETVNGVHTKYGDFLWRVEWGFTALFTVEYILRLLCVADPKRYARSFFGIVDLLAVLPTYLSLFVGGTQSFLVIRAVRLLRIFRVLKLARFSTETEILAQAIRASRRKIIVFVGAVITIVVIMGAAMYLIEGPARGFADIPSGMYWAIVTMTTVGYGDIVPHTVLGKIIASVIMIMGYGLIAVPTGIVSVELAHATKLSVSTETCPHCQKEGHDVDALFCRFCGGKL